MSPVTIAWTATGAICPDQFDRIAKMGNIGMSFFTPHVYFWGDMHRDFLLGPERRPGSPR